MYGLQVAINHIDPSLVVARNETQYLMEFDMGIQTKNDILENRIKLIRRSLTSKPSVDEKDADDEIDLTAFSKISGVKDFCNALDTSARRISLNKLRTLMRAINSDQLVHQV